MKLKRIPLKNKTTRKRVSLKKKSLQTPVTEKDTFTVLYNNYINKLKKLPDVEACKWININSRIPDNTDNPVVVKDKQEYYQVVPSFVALQHYIYEKHLFASPNPIIEWMKL